MSHARQDQGEARAGEARCVGLARRSVVSGVCIITFIYLRFVTFNISRLLLLFLFSLVISNFFFSCLPNFFFVVFHRQGGAIVSLIFVSLDLFTYIIFSLLFFSPFFSLL